MNAEQVNAVGGWCELVGVAFLVRDLMSLARFREKPKEWATRLKQWATRVSRGVPAGTSRERENVVGLPADAGIVSGS
jgi:hypothetical protein